MAQVDEFNLPPHNTAIDEGGVNLRGGYFNYSNTDIAIGPPDASSRLQLTRIYPAGTPGGATSFNPDTQIPFGWSTTHNYDIRIYCVPTEDDYYNTPEGGETTCSWGNIYTILVGGKGYLMYYNSGKGYFESSGGEGAIARTTGVGFSVEFIDKNGVAVNFDISNQPYTDTSLKRCALWSCFYASSITYPNGEKVSLSYEHGLTYYSNFKISRLSKVESSRGFGLRFSYLAPSASNFNLQALYISRVDSYTLDCPQPNCPKTDRASTHYGYTVSQYWSNSSNPKPAYLTSVTDVHGNVTTYHMTGNLAYEKISGISVPNNPSLLLVSNTYTDGKITSQTDATGRTKTYQYHANETRVTDSGSSVRKYGFSSSNPQNEQPHWVEDALNNRIEHGYDIHGRLTQIKDPAGGIVALTLDDRGNVTERRVKARTGFSVPDTVTTASFPACSLSNIRICNRPTYTIDAGGGRTDFTYNAANGEVTSRMDPAAPSGMRPTTNFGYSWFSGTSGAFELLTSVTENINASDAVTTGYEYDPSNYFALKGQTITAGGQTVRRCLRSDPLGRVISQTEPRAGLTSCL